ncbi:hypothetical protein BU15DRAFT_80243 [Melanogaster broomeanus]|nr:hypothetical protein BU15DRAFT_80243 [Melanogaster broomeanus]
MDGLSSATTIIAIIETGATVIGTLVKYSASVKNARKSCQRLIEEIELINSLAHAAEESVHKLSTGIAPGSFCRCWIDPQSPAMRYKSELDKFMMKLSEKQDVSRVKGMIRRLGWPAKESEIKAAIESFERFPIVSTPSKTQGEEQRTLVKAAIDSNELQQMYNWMDAVNCTTKYEITLRQRQDETCKWLFDLQRYSDWCSSRNAFLRVRGKTGAGNSVLISAVIESLSKTGTKGVIRSFLTHLLRMSKDNWLPLFDDLVDRKSSGSPPPVDLEILYQLLLRACNDYVKLTAFLARLHNEGSCRIFCTSRPLPDAPKTFTDLPSIDLHDMSAETLRQKLHIEKEVAKYDKLASLRDEIVPSLLKKADGMFRWVQCQLDRLSGCRTQSNIQGVLATLPSGLYETYDKILSDINKEFDGQIAKTILLWLVDALHPLSLKLLIEAVTFDIQRSETFSGDDFLSNEDVLGVCGSLVSYDGKVVSLSHFSVKEYLFDEHLHMGALTQYHLSLPITNLHLAKLCIDYFCAPQMIPRFQICIKSLQLSPWFIEDLTPGRGGRGCRRRIHRRGT